MVNAAMIEEKCDRLAARICERGQVHQRDLSALANASG
jgi:hypothetical protein